MYDVSIVPAPIQRRRALVQEPDELEKVDQHVEEVALVTQTQSDTGYVSLVMMMSVFRTGYYDSGVDQSSDFKTQYMHGHGHDRGEHNEYLYYEALAADPVAWESVLLLLGLVEQISRVVPAWVSFAITTYLGLCGPTGRQSSMDIDMIRVARRGPCIPIVLVSPSGSLQTRRMPPRRGARRGGGRGGRGAGRGQPEEQPAVSAVDPNAPVT
ncbi:GATA zinc finger domain-containing protein 10-like isoform X2 [Cucumis melo var. makuwa]|uniref:GATA zinc finger domain-containing protein 10-like isoform X2 n=1 Tax=Cucumis melo var. makuwa TaxID=1194695 RepID=A0A5D3CH08_CUCMM|nr:GATA zinc finger domain-containing protein 10-like isoform X2 [Cucumis melo var. makuwa]